MGDEDVWGVLQKVYSNQNVSAEEPLCATPALPISRASPGGNELASAATCADVACTRPPNPRASRRRCSSSVNSRLHSFDWPQCASPYPLSHAERHVRRRLRGWARGHAAAPDAGRARAVDPELSRVHRGLWTFVLSPVAAPARRAGSRWAGVVRPSTVFRTSSFTSGRPKKGRPGAPIAATPAERNTVLGPDKARRAPAQLESKGM